MPILKRVVPEPLNIKDFRDNGGIYYEAKCEQCGRIFYPKRGTAMYCSKRCGIEYRNGGILANPLPDKPPKVSNPTKSGSVKKPNNLLTALEKLKLKNKRTRL